MSRSPFHRLAVPPDLYAAVIGHARAEAPIECCGLLAGRIQDGVGLVETRYPLVNDAASPVEFVSEARGMFEATRDIDRRGLLMLAVYHSHPSSAPVPSRTDLARSYSPDVASVIVSLRGGVPAVLAWWLRDDHYVEAELFVGPTPEEK